MTPLTKVVSNNVPVLDSQQLSERDARYERAKGICYRMAVMIAAGYVGQELAGFKGSMCRRARAFHEILHALAARVLLDQPSTVTITYGWAEIDGKPTCVDGGHCRILPKSWPVRQWGKLRQFLFPTPPCKGATDGEQLDGYAYLFAPGAEAEFLRGVREHATNIALQNWDRHVLPAVSKLEQEGELTSRELDKLFAGANYAPGVPAGAPSELIQ